MIHKVATDLIIVTMVMPRLKENQPSALTMYVQRTKDKSGKEKTTSSSSGLGNKKLVVASSTTSSHTSKSTLITISTNSSNNNTQPGFYEVNFFF